MAAEIGKAGLETSPDCFAITGNDSTDLAVECRALLIGTGGVIKLTTGNNQSVTLTVPSGVLPVRTKRVWLTSLTAVGITGLV